MTMMKSPFNQVLNGTHGHCIDVTAGVPIWIPPVVIPQAVAQGMTVVEETTNNDAPSLEPTAPVTAKVVAPTETSDNSEDDVDAFGPGLNDALTRIIVRNDPADLKSDGVPKLNKVVAEMSPDLRRPTATEISDAYQVLQENIDLAE